MNRFRLAPLLLSLLLLTGCGGRGSDLSPEQRTELYRTAIAGARGQELNDILPIATSTEDDMGQIFFDALSLSPEDCAACALSVSLMNVKAYGIAAVYPKEGREDAVAEGLRTFIEAQQQSFQLYLPDQYEIAQSARLETLKDGTILLVMCEDQNQIFDAIRTAIETGG